MEINVLEKQYCTFYLCDLFLGIEVTRVQEVLKYNEITSVPLAPKVICGLTNLRGQIVTAIDLRRRLELPERPAEDNYMNIIIKNEESVYSFLVDKIGDVIEISEKNFEPAPETLKGVARELIKGAYKLKESLLLILDTHQVLNLI